jgi:hypothetical protein
MAAWSDGTNNYVMGATQASVALVGGTYLAALRYLQLGNNSVDPSFAQHGWLSNVCVDSNPSRCR